MKGATIVYHGISDSGIGKHVLIGLLEAESMAEIVSSHYNQWVEG